MTHSPDYRDMAHMMVPRASAAPQPQRNSQGREETFLRRVTSRLNLPANASTEQIFAAVENAVAAAKPKAMIIPVGELEQLQEDAAQGRAILAQATTDRQEGIIASAIREGRINPDHREQWAAALKSDEKGTTTLIASLTKRPLDDVNQDLYQRMYGEDDEVAYNRLFPDGDDH